MKEAEKVKIYVRIPEGLLRKIRVLVDKGYYRDESDFIVDAIRHRIEEYEEKKPELFSEL